MEFFIIAILVCFVVGKSMIAKHNLSEAQKIKDEYTSRLAAVDKELKALKGQKEKLIIEINHFKESIDYQKNKLREELTLSENMYLIQKHQLSSEISTLKDRKKRAAEEYQQKKEILKHDFDLFKDTLCSDAEAYQIVSSEVSQHRPQIAKIYADIICERDITIADRLLLKDRPAIKAANSIKAISAEKRKLIAENKSLTYQLEFYESLFPWLEEFKEVPIDEAISYVSQSDSESNDEYEYIRNWLSPEEYQSLGTAEKYQLALDRWKRRKKTDWEIGIEYERYIGYRLEKEGYTVEYFGAKMGLGDMGRDLLATKDGVTLVIQCKRWAKDKTIHEKHICQLYGSVAVLATQNPSRHYKGVFITSASLSDTAKLFADYSNIQYVEACPMADYPVVKCNLSNTGEKIYHLPFDQQYDRVVVSPNKGEFFALTVADAESAGFRRAFRWHCS